MSELLDLNWDVFATPGIPTVTSDLPPGTTRQMWSAISSTLIYGKRDAVLVDLSTLVKIFNEPECWTRITQQSVQKDYTPPIKRLDLRH